MKELKANCPCCNRQFKIVINQDGEISTIFFDEEKYNQDELVKILEEKGIYLGVIK